MTNVWQQVKDFEPCPNIYLKRWSYSYNLKFGLWVMDSITATKWPWNMGGHDTWSKAFGIPAFGIGVWHKF